MDLTRSRKFLNASESCRKTHDQITSTLYNGIVNRMPQSYSTGAKIVQNDQRYRHQLPTTHNGFQTPFLADVDNYKHWKLAKWSSQDPNGLIDDTRRDGGELDAQKKFQITPVSTRPLINKPPSNRPMTLAKSSGSSASGLASRKMRGTPSGPPHEAFEPRGTLPTPPPSLPSTPESSRRAHNAISHDFHCFRSLEGLYNIHSPLPKRRKTFIDLTLCSDASASDKSTYSSNSASNSSDDESSEDETSKKIIAGQKFFTQPKAKLPVTPVRPTKKDSPVPNHTSKPFSSATDVKGPSGIENIDRAKVNNLYAVQVKQENLLAKLRTRKRDQFYLAHAEVFLHLLPEINYISKLVASGTKAIPEHRSIGVMVPSKQISQPAGITATMKNYQLDGLKFLVYLYNNGVSGILGDEMGLGKTLQTLSLFQYLRETVSISEDQSGPCLVICPLSVLQSWVSESRRFAPNLKIVRFHGRSERRDEIKKSLDGRFGTRKRAINFDVMFTTYEMFEEEAAFFKRAYQWDCVVLDEGHRVKNPNSKISKLLHGIRASFKLILTGTPLQNNLHELWALLHWLFPETFAKNTDVLFKRSFDLGRGVVNNTVMSNARELLEIIMLRRTKESPGVNLGIPPKSEVILLVPLSSYQRRLYKACITGTDDLILNEIFDNAAEKERLAALDEEEEDHDDSQTTIESGGKSSQSERAKTSKSTHRKLLNIVMQLRQICIHPYQIPDEVPEPYTVGEHVITASGKFVILSKMIDELVIKQKRKALIFSEFRGVLDCCEDLLYLKGGGGSAFRYLRFDGDTGRARRNLNIRLFNSRPGYQVMLISTMAGALGINLTTATEVIFLDETWNPQITLQAEARAHRIGQTKTVTVYKICTQGTVEQQMLGRIQKKLYLSTKVAGSMQSVHSNTRSNKIGATQMENIVNMNTSQLQNLIRRGVHALSHSVIDISELTDWDWATTLERCTSNMDIAGNTELANENVRNGENEEEKWLSTIEKVKCAVFEGKRHSKRKINTLVESEDLDRAARRIGKEVTVKVGEDYVNKASLACKEWEAVPTLTGHLEKAQVKHQKRRQFVSQQLCQTCWGDEESLIHCVGCPRTCHIKCFDPSNAPLTKQQLVTWYCPQHRCTDCDKTTSSVGGLLFRCRYCLCAFCEDCLDWDKSELIDDSLPELEALGYEANSQAFYIVCTICKPSKDKDPELFAEYVSLIGTKPSKKRPAEETSDGSPAKRSRT